MCEGSMYGPKCEESGQTDRPDGKAAKAEIFCTIGFARYACFMALEAVATWLGGAKEVRFPRGVKTNVSADPLQVGYDDMILPRH